MNDLKNRVKQATGAEPEQPGTEQPGTAVDLARNDNVLSWLQERRSYFAGALPKHVSVRQFTQAALTCLRTNKALLRCDKASLTYALMQCARYGLDPDGTQAAIVPYGKTATFVPMYQGYVELMYRSGFIESVVFSHIHENDHWSYDVGQRPPNDFTHRPDLLSSGRGEPVLAYAFAWMKGGARSQIVFLNRSDAEQIRDTRSKAYELAERNRREDAHRFAQNPDWGKFNSPWHTDFDAMWLKSAVRRLVKRVPTSAELRELDRLDTQDEIIDGEWIEPIAELDAVAEPEDSDETPAGESHDPDAVAAEEAAAEAAWPDVAQSGGDS